uniref:Riboflavinspecific deaminase/GTP cyclohydrolase II putative n=1 Tax=Albugo laibachii Nc14 TaxID=890382 RepID=F0W8P0_9STRA|nr:riboflavinspecific deaminase/GTP cyclohydrolase II putative [Albugo laibachii Nc14]|eukprot:CCA17497.1 riboflavinspecific deaminase/GTP cyclohydrolase II putative [Albugo laibachii Nc14]
MMTLHRTAEIDRIWQECDDAMMRWTKDKSAKYPMITLTYAQSIDGCIAAKKGSPTILSGSASKRMTHVLRTLHQGILIGIGTLISDNPSLTSQDLVSTSIVALQSRKKALEQAGAVIIECESICTSEGAQHVHLSRAFELLHNYGFESIMVEGGAGIITSCLREQTIFSLVSLVIITIAPIFIGGVHSVNSILSSSNFPRLRYTQCIKMDEDMVLVAHF